MRRIFTVGLLLLTALTAVSACTDRIPTLSDVGRFADGTLPRTFQHEFQAVEVLTSAEVQEGDLQPFDAIYKLVAQDFDGSLNSHLLAQFNEFPTSVLLTTGVDSSLTFLDSFVIATLPDTLRVSSQILAFNLWAVTQPFDSIDVSWQNAVDKPNSKIPWTQPGGTRGDLLSTVVWQQADTVVSADSLKWIIRPEVVTALASGEIPGLMVTLETPNSRAEISSLAIDARIKPSTQDTIVSVIVDALAQTFIFDPPPPKPQNTLRVGGVSGDRSVLHFSIDKLLPACDPPLATCTDWRDPSSVTLNRVDLLLDPQPVTHGYRPIVPIQLTLRRLLEPELGAKAPLASIVTVDTVSIAKFLVQQSEPISFFVTSAVNLSLLRGDTKLDLSLLVEPDGTTPSYAWFGRNVRLRYVYTLPQTPQLP